MSGMFQRRKFELLRSTLIRCIDLLDSGVESWNDLVQTCDNFRIRLPRGILTLFADRDNNTEMLGTHFEWCVGTKLFQEFDDAGSINGIGNTIPNGKLMRSPIKINMMSLKCPFSGFKNCSGHSAVGKTVLFQFSLKFSQVPS